MRRGVCDTPGARGLAAAAVTLSQRARAAVYIDAAPIFNPITTSSKDAEYQHDHADLERELGGQ